MFLAGFEPNPVKKGSKRVPQGSQGVPGPPWDPLGPPGTPKMTLFWTTFGAKHGLKTGKNRGFGGQKWVILGVPGGPRRPLGPLFDPLFHGFHGLTGVAMKVT